MRSELEKANPIRQANLDLAVLRASHLNDSRLNDIQRLLLSLLYYKYPTAADTIDDSLYVIYFVPDWQDRLDTKVRTEKLACVIGATNIEIFNPRLIGIPRDDTIHIDYCDKYTFAKVLDFLRCEQ